MNIIVTGEDYGLFFFFLCGVKHRMLLTHPIIGLSPRVTDEKKSGFPCEQ